MICLEIDNYLAVLTIGSADGNHAITERMVNLFKDACQEVRERKDVRALIITGSGNGTFCGSAGEEGADEIDCSVAWIDAMSLGPTLDALRCPVIAAINGAALGQGLELALACDLRISSETATFAMPQVTCGMIPWDGGTQRLSRIVGKGKALEMTLLGDAIDAGEALRIGLVHQVASPAGLVEAAERLGRKMASCSPVALAFVKEAVCKGADLTLDQGLRLEADLYYLLHTTEDRTEGINAFKEKRKPAFTGK